MKNSVFRRNRNLRRNESGASAVEFALIAPVFITLMMGIVEFSMVLYTYASAGHATRDVTRRIATNRLTAANASTTLKPQLPAWVQNHATVNVAQTTPGTPATNQITVTVSFPTSKATPTSFMTVAYGSSTLQTATTMQQEN